MIADHSTEHLAEVNTPPQPVPPAQPRSTDESATDDSTEHLAGVK